MNAYDAAWRERDGSYPPSLTVPLTADNIAADDRTLAYAFRRLLRNHDTVTLLPWIATANRSPIARFVRGLRDDVKAANAGVAVPLSRGQVDGQLLCVTLAKRSVQGQAGFGFEVLVSHRLAQNMSVWRNYVQSRRQISPNRLPALRDCRCAGSTRARGAGRCPLRAPVEESMPPADYMLPGTLLFPQVEPESSYWARCPVPRAPSLAEITAAVGPAPPYPTAPATVNAEIAQLHALYAARNAALPAAALSAYLRSTQFTTNPPPGAVHSTCVGPPFIRTGAELARLFQAETPGLWHRHVLTVLFDPSHPAGLGQLFSPPRQALIWAALDVATSSALQAAWHYKWLGGSGIQFRQRPKEYDPALPVLYDYATTIGCPLGEGGIKASPPPPTPGTPRHPAYPSGHSTYAAAASYVLACLVERHLHWSWWGQMRKLARNIGGARLWGGVHWATDDTFGFRLGRAVGSLIIQQLNRSGIDATATPRALPPSVAMLQSEAATFERQCGRARENHCGLISVFDWPFDWFGIVRLERPEPGDEPVPPDFPGVEPPEVERPGAQPGPVTRTGFMNPLENIPEEIVRRLSRGEEGTPPPARQ